MFYDGELILSLKDDMGGLYVAELVTLSGDGNDEPTYHAVSVSNEDLMEFSEKLIDLRTLFMRTTDLDHWYVGAFSDEDVLSELEVVDGGFPDIILPPHGIWATI